MNIRAKMKCWSVTPFTAPGSESETIILEAVTSGSVENESFSKWTPSARFQMQVTNPAVFGKFIQGKEYFLDFSPAN